MTITPSDAASKPASWRTAAEAARACHELGLSTVALVPRSKQPKIKSYPALGLVMPAPEQAQHLETPCEVALVGGHGAFAVDVDAGEEAATPIIKKHLGEPLCVVRGNRGCKMLYAMERPDAPAELSPLRPIISAT